MIMLLLLIVTTHSLIAIQILSSSSMHLISLSSTQILSPSNMCIPSLSAIQTLNQLTKVHLLHNLAVTVDSLVTEAENGNV